MRKGDEDASGGRSELVPELWRSQTSILRRPIHVLLDLEGTSCFACNPIWSVAFYTVELQHPWHRRWQEFESVWDTWFSLLLVHLRHQLQKSPVLSHIPLEYRRNRDPNVPQRAIFMIMLCSWWSALRSLSMALDASAPMSLSFLKYRIDLLKIPPITFGFESSGIRGKSQRISERLCMCWLGVKFMQANPKPVRSVSFLLGSRRKRCEVGCLRARTRALVGFLCIHRVCRYGKIR